VPCSLYRQNTISPKYLNGIELGQIRNSSQLFFLRIVGEWLENITLLLTFHKDKYSPRSERANKGKCVLYSAETSSKQMNNRKKIHLQAHHF